MKKIIKNIFIITLISLFIYSCQGAKDALQGKKRSEQSDEFLVKKKNPLTKPPDFEKLPEPGDQRLNETSDELDVKDLLEIENNDDENNSNSSEDLIDNILKKIQ